VHVKETPVHINDFSMAHESDVRFAGKIGFIESVSETQGMND
jgi:hypothetical protein